MTRRMLRSAKLWLLAPLCAAGCLAAPSTSTPPPTEDPPVVDPPPVVDKPPVDPPPTLPVGTTPIGRPEECEVDQLDKPEVYGTKIKSTLTGLALTSDELATLRDDPDALAGMIDGWLATPQADDVFRHFFMTAFQQDQVTGDALMEMLDTNNVNYGRWSDTQENMLPLLIDNMQQSFARTALRLVKEGRPFNEVLTTDTFEMTTALKVFYAFVDQRHLDEQGALFERPIGAFTSYVALRNLADEPPVEEVLDPNSPNAMHFFVPEFDSLCTAADVNELPFQANGFITDKSHFIFSLMFGRAQVVINRGGAAGCRAASRPRQPMLAQSDFSDWTTVHVRKPNAGEQPTRFFRLVAIRGAQELVLEADRVGFFTTMGFFNTWPTNEDNAARVTVNQTLITALGASFDGTTVTDFSPPNLDEEHSAPGSACYGCHQTLDPMREFVRQSFSPTYGRQHDPARIDAEAQFVFRGVQSGGQGVLALANILADHPDFPAAWAEKLCFFANSQACPKGSPELARVVDAFKASNLDFKVLVRTLFSSPLVTNAACIDGGTGGSRSIARHDQFCAKLSGRLGVQDVCALDTPNRQRTALQRLTSTGMASVPADTFSRGEPDPITISETGLFVRASREVVCTGIGERAYDAAFGGMSRNEAIEKMVVELMGLLPSDSRHDEAVAILRDHVTDGVAQGATQRDALRSALVVACMSPGMAGVGF